MGHYCEDCRGNTSSPGSPCYDGCENCPCESQIEPERLAGPGIACNHQGLPNDMPPCHCEMCDCSCHSYENDEPDFDQLDEDNFDWDSYQGPN